MCFGDKKSLTIVIGHAGEYDAEIELAAHGPCGVARKHIDLAGFQRLEPVRCRQGDKFDLGRIVEDCGRDSPAEIDVEAAPFALLVHRREANQSLADTANQRAAVLDGFQRLRVRNAQRGTEDDFDT